MNQLSFFKSGSLIVALSLLGLATSGNAQQTNLLDFNHPSVTVDLSVIEDSGYGQPGVATTPGLRQPARGKLLIPGARAPSSMLHVAPVGGAVAAPTLRSAIAEPAAMPVAKAPALKKQVAPKTPVISKQAVARVEPVAAPPAPPVPKKLEAPAAAPAPIVEPKIQTAPPPPPVVAKAQVPVRTEPVKKKVTEQASLPPASTTTKTTIEPGIAMQVVFPNDATRIPADAVGKLKSLAAKVRGQENLRLQLMAYAGGEDLSSSLARRLSLSRALSVRSLLIEGGIRSTRIDVRALGNKTDVEPFNRVDLNITER